MNGAEKFPCMEQIVPDHACLQLEWSRYEGGYLRHRFGVLSTPYRIEYEISFGVLIQITRRHNERTVA